MKKQLGYLKLWQQKRSELHVNDDAQQGWGEMKGLLDQHLPVNTHAGTVKPHVIGYKLLSVLTIAVTTAALVTYLVLRSGTDTSGPVKPSAVKRNVTTTDTSAVLNTNDTSQSRRDTAGTNGTMILPDRKVSDGNPGSSATNSNTRDAVKGSSGALSINGSSSNGNGSKPYTSSLRNLSGSGVIVPHNKVTAGSTGKPEPGNSASGDAVKKANADRLITDKKGVNTTRLNNRTSALVKRSGKYPRVAKPWNGPSGFHHRSRFGGSGAVFRTRLAHSANQEQLAHTAKQGEMPDSEKSDQDRKGSSSDNKQPASGVNKGDTSLVANQQLSYSTSIQPLQARQDFYTDSAALIAFRAKSESRGFKSMSLQPLSTAKGSGKNGKGSKVRSGAEGNFDWGILVGVNASGSFTPKSANANFYGSLPVDVSLGLFGTYHFNDRWAINPQLSMLNPVLLSGTYTHANQSKIDSGQTLVMTDSRKVYAVNMPLYLVYQLNNYISLKAGPVFSLPIKQANVISSFSPGKNKKDSAYYVQVTSQVKATNYTKAINYGMAGGVSFQLQHLSLDVTYLKNFQGVKVTSALGSYQSNTGTLQFTIGFKLNGLLHNGINIGSGKKPKATSSGPK